MIEDKSTVGSSAAPIRHHQGPMTVSLNGGCRDGIVSLTLIWVGKQQKRMARCLLVYKNNLELRPPEVCNMPRNGDSVVKHFLTDFFPPYLGITVNDRVLLSIWSRHTCMCLVKVFQKPYMIMLCKTLDGPTLSSLLLLSLCEVSC